MEATPLFEAIINSNQKIIVSQGGSWSGKTIANLQAVIYELLSEPNLLCTVMGQDIPNLKRGSIRDFENLINDDPFLKANIIDHNKSERTYEFINGSKVEFVSYSNAQDAKNGKRDLLFINEANGIDYEICRQTMMRTRKKVYIDYNPDAEFWVHTHLLSNPNAVFLYSDHRNNPYVPDEIRNELEALKDVDIELWKIYARGITGRIEGLIYRNWNIISTAPDETQIKFCYGLDFGYNHPTALIKCGWDDAAFHVEEVIYETGLTTSDLIARMRTLNLGSAEIYCDSARPDTIEELYQAGFNVMKSDKTIKDGINLVKSKPLNVYNSPNLVKELRTYKWKTDKNKKALDEPIKFNDDAMDAMRYGFYNGVNAEKNTISWY